MVVSLESEKEKTMANRKVSSEEFVRAFEECRTCAEVAARLSVTRKAVYTRATKLRNHGVELKRMCPAGALDVVGLNALIEALRAKGGG